MLDRSRICVCVRQFGLKYVITMNQTLILRPALKSSTEKSQKFELLLCLAQLSFLLETSYYYDYCKSILLSHRMMNF